jgi:hypothetical protein
MGLRHLTLMLALAVAAPAAALAAPPQVAVSVRVGSTRAAYGQIVDRRYERQQHDPAFRNGYADGYTAGLNDGRRRHRDAPFASGRFRSADHNYRREYGPRDAYRFNYRDGFREGYERGYWEGRRLR